MGEPAGPELLVHCCHSDLGVARAAVGGIGGGDGHAGRARALRISDSSHGRPGRPDPDCQRRGLLQPRDRTVRRDLVGRFRTPATLVCLPTLMPSRRLDRERPSKDLFSSVRPGHRRAVRSERSDVGLTCDRGGLPGRRTCGGARVRWPCPGQCSVVRPTASFAKRCDGSIAVTIDYPASAPGVTSVEVYGTNAPVPPRAVRYRSARESTSSARSRRRIQPASP
jgi:hypothetical protein